MEKPKTIFINKVMYMGKALSQENTIFSNNGNGDAVDKA